MLWRHHCSHTDHRQAAKQICSRADDSKKSEQVLVDFVAEDRSEAQSHHSTTITRVSFAVDRELTKRSAQCSTLFEGAICVHSDMHVLLLLFTALTTLLR
jgi:hypothetical protein